ncbi:MAG: hypothetical protein WKG52_00495 [Variovorax sp.]
MILVKTEAGQQVLKDRSIRLTPRQRSAFILCDGRRSVNEVLEAGMGITREDIEQMVEIGLLGQIGTAGENGEPPTQAHESTDLVAQVGLQDVPSDLATASAAPKPARSNQQRYKDAYPIATQLTGSLGLRGFRLNLSVEGTSMYEELLALAPKIREAVGPEKAAALERALKD